MGKSLKGKELGTGISQRKDGLYTGRVTDRNGKRVQKYFKKLADCKKWVADAQCDILYNKNVSLANPTIDIWFEYWIENIKKPTVRVTSYNKYMYDYTKYISPNIGNYKIKEIKPLICIEFLNELGKNHTKNYVDGIKILMHDFFDSAVENGLILLNPITSKIKVVGQNNKNFRVLTTQEQKDFLIRMKKYKNYNFFALALQTGMRIGELRALTWDNIDFENKLLKVTQNMYLDHNQSKIGLPKSKNGIRTIPLTQEAINILKNQKEQNSNIKIIKTEYKNFVFLNTYGGVTAPTVYQKNIRDYCKKYNVPSFSVHTLRHTYATRCIEAGINPKTLQMIMGHSKLSITMDLYVHVTEETKVSEIGKLETLLNQI